MAKSKINVNDTLPPDISSLFRLGIYCIAKIEIIKTKISRVIFLNIKLKSLEYLLIEKSPSESLGAMKI